MSTRSISFFALPSEFFDWMADAEESIPLDFALGVKEPFQGFVKASLEQVREHSFWRFYAAHRWKEWPIEDDDMNPNAWALVTCDRPEIVEGDTLLLASISSKSDYYGAPLARGRYAHRLFSKIRKIIVRDLVSPTWARNIKYPDDGASAYRDVWHSKGAAQWMAGGGKLRQRGVANVKYFIEETDD